MTQSKGSKRAPVASAITAADASGIGDPLGDARHVLERLGEYTWVWNLSDDSVTFSDNFLARFGYASSDIPSGSVWRKFLHPDDVDKVWTKTLDCLSGEVERLEQIFRLRKPNGEYIWLRSRAVVDVRNDKGAPLRMVGIYTDVDEYMQAQFERDEAEERWNFALESARAGVWDWRIGSDEMYFSPRWKALRGYQDDELENVLQTWVDLIVPEDRKDCMVLLDRFVGGEIPEYRSEVRMRNKDGSVSWVLVSALIVEWDADDTPSRVIGTHEDITEAKEREAELIASNRHLDLIAARVPGFVFEFRLHKNGSHKFTYATEGITQHFGLSADDLREDARSAIDAIHPDDADDVRRAFLESGRNGTQWDQEYRAVINGEIRWLHGIGNPVEDRVDEDVLVWHGYIADITERKQRELALAQSRERLEKVAANVPGFVYEFRLDANGKESYPYVSDGIEDVFGITAEQAMLDADAVYRVIDETDAERLRQRLASESDQGKVWREDFRVRRDGELRWVREISHPRPEPEADGSLVWHGYAYDITDSVARESAINESRARLALIAGNLPGFVFQYRRSPDGVGYITYVSEGAAEILNVEPGEQHTLAVEVFAGLDPEDAARIDQGLTQSQTELGRWEDEYRLVQDGVARWFRFMAAPMEAPDESGATVWHGYTYEVTEQRRVENELEGSRRQLALVAANVPGYVFQYKRYADGRHCIPYASEGMREVLGVDPASIREDASLAFAAIHPEDLPTIERTMAEAARNRTRWSMEWRAIRDGEVRWMSGVADPMTEPATKDNDGGAVVWHGYSRDITERKLAELAVEESRQQLETIAANVPGMVYQYRLYPDKSGRLNYCSEGIRELFGLAPETVADDAAQLFEAIHPEDREQVVNSIRTSAKHLNNWRVEFRVRVEDRHSWVLGTGEPMPDKGPDGELIWNGYMYDITAQKQNELDLAESRRRLEAIAEHVPGVVYQFRLLPGGTGQFTYASEGIRKIYNVAPEHVAENVDMVMQRIHPHDRKAVIAAINQSAEDRTQWNQEYRVVIDGETHWLHGIADPMIKADADGAVVWHGYITDITERKQSYVMIQNRTRALEQANAELEEFNYIASHDLKEPLRGIRHLSDWIRDDLRESAIDSVGDNLDRLDARTQRMQTLIDDLAQYSRAGRGVLNVSAVEIAALVEEICTDIDNRGCRIDLSGVQQIMLETPAVILRTVLRNLITNAVVHHHQPDQGTVRVAVSDDGDACVFSVEDDGPGIEARHHKRIFRIYQQLNPERNRVGSGSGLAIVKRSLARVGSEIVLESPLAAGGSRFSFRWPKQWSDDSSDIYVARDDD